MVKVVVLAGTAGTGKSTIGEELSSLLSCEFIEGDNLHPQSNIEKMSHGIPLNDEDRWDWLAEVSKKATESALDNQGGEKTMISVISCSALKKIYRDHIRKTSPDTEFTFLFLYCGLEVLLKRVGQREGHFMKGNMLKSQFDILELPDETVQEDGCFVVNVEELSISAVVEKCLKCLG